MKIRILMISHNRPSYTYLSLSKLCDTLPESASVTVWDNASDPETKNVLKMFENNEKVHDIIYSKKNFNLTLPTNTFWNNNSDADFLGKVDDDCIVPDEWIATLTSAHKDIANCGIIGCWHYKPEDFDESVATKKIFSYNGHKILRNCWIGGSGYIMSRKVLNTIGILKKNESFTTYCIRASAKGFINGWYYPFLFQEHMDDPRSVYFMFQNNDEFRSQRPLTAKNFEIDSIEEWKNRLKNSARTLQTCSLDPNDYIGIRPKFRRLAQRFFHKT